MSVKFGRLLLFQIIEHSYIFTAALNFREWLGGEVKINEFCHKLAVTGGAKVAEILKTRVLDENAEFTANMVSPHTDRQVRISSADLLTT